MKSLKVRFINQSVFILVLLILTSCVSQKKCMEKSDLCGIVVDENNNPINNFKITCSSNIVDGKSAYTNNSGIFFIPDLKVGEYYISGEKDNYAKVPKQKFLFNGSQSLFCTQVISLESLLEKVELLIQNEEYLKALKFIEQMEFSKDQLNEALILLYKAYLNLKLEKYELYEDCLKQLKKSKNEKLKKLFEGKEILIYEKF